MRKLLCSLFCFLSIGVIAQISVDATIVEGVNDTVSAKLRVWNLLFTSKTIDERSFNKTLVLLDENNKRNKKLKARDVQYLRFIDFKNQERVFVNDGKLLKELVYDGRIKWYRTTSSNPFNGSIEHQNYMISESGEQFNFFGLFDNNRNNLKEITRDKPELAEQIDEMKLTIENFENILRMYDLE